MGTERVELPKENRRKDLSLVLRDGSRGPGGRRICRGPGTTRGQGGAPNLSNQEKWYFHAIFENSKLLKQNKTKKPTMKKIPKF